MTADGSGDTALGSRAGGLAAGTSCGALRTAGAGSGDGTNGRGTRATAGGGDITAGACVAVDGTVGVGAGAVADTDGDVVRGGAGAIEATGANVAVGGGVGDAIRGAVVGVDVVAPAGASGGRASRPGRVSRAWTDRGRTERARVGSVTGTSSAAIEGVVSGSAAADEVAGGGDGAMSTGLASTGAEAARSGSSDRTAAD